MNLKSMQSRKKHMIEDTLSVQFHLCDLPGKAKPMDVLKISHLVMGIGMGSVGTSGACSLSVHIFTFSGLPFSHLRFLHFTPY